MKLRNTWFFDAIARTLASASTSVIGGGSASGSRMRIEPGTMASVIASSESWPTVRSMCAISASLGPMWRSPKASWCSSERREAGVLVMAGGSWEWAPLCPFAWEFEAPGEGSRFVHLRRRQSSRKPPVAPEFSQPVVLGPERLRALRLRQRVWPASPTGWLLQGDCRSGHRFGWGPCRVAGERDAFAVVQVRELHPAGPPVGLGLFDPFLARGHEVPLDEALAQRLAAEQHQQGRAAGGGERDRTGPEH